MNYNFAIPLNLQKTSLYFSQAGFLALQYNLSVSNAIIVAMCLVYHLPLFTYNLADFQFIEGIDIFRT